jgi:hypothetical protein
VNVEHKRYGRNWSSVKVEGKTFNEAVSKAVKDFTSQERVESVELIAATD